MATRTDYTKLIEGVEEVLRAEIGKHITPKLRFDYYEVTIADKPAPGHSTPVEFRLIINPISADTDGDNSSEALEELNYIEHTEAWLKTLDFNLPEGTVFFDF